MSYKKSVDTLRKEMGRHGKYLKIFEDTNGIDILTAHRFNFKITKTTGARFVVKNDDEYIGNFYLSGFPGCCGICISTGAFVEEIYRGTGIGTALNKFKIAIAKKLGYSVIVCTCIDGPTKRIMKKNGWVKVLDFQNKRTYNIVDMYAYHIYKKKRRVA